MKFHLAPKYSCNVIQNDHRADPLIIDSRKWIKLLLLRKLNLYLYPLQSSKPHLEPEM